MTSPPYTASDTGVLPGDLQLYSARVQCPGSEHELLVSVAASVTVTAAVAQQLYFIIQTDHLDTPPPDCRLYGYDGVAVGSGEPFGSDVPNNNPSGQAPSTSP